MLPPVRRFEFHLQGQHDQQDHAGGRAKSTVLDDLEGYDPEVAAERAAAMRAQAEAVEPELTASLAKMIGDSDPAGYEAPERGEGDLYGYDFRLKSEAKIAEKIGRVMVEKNMTLDEATADIKDAVRYTAHFDEEEFGERTQSVIDTLRAENPNVVVKNTWPPEKGVPYKGVNVNVYREDGLVYEVQFHTPGSQAVKDQMHLLYEEQRVLPKSNPRWQVLEDEMLAMGSGQPVPRDAYKVFRVMKRRTPWYTDSVTGEAAT